MALYTHKWEVAIYLIRKIGRNVREKASRQKRTKYIFTFFTHFLELLCTLEEKARIVGL